MGMLMTFSFNEGPIMKQPRVKCSALMMVAHWLSSNLTDPQDDPLDQVTCFINPGNRRGRSVIPFGTCHRTVSAASNVDLKKATCGDTAYDFLLGGSLLSWTVDLGGSRMTNTNGVASSWYRCRSERSSRSRSLTLPRLVCMNDAVVTLDTRRNKVKIKPVGLSGPWCIGSSNEAGARQ